MLPISFARQSLTRKRPSQISDHGNVAWDYVHTTDTPLNGCVISPLQSAEVSINRDATLTQYQVLAPVSDIKDYDHFWYNGKEYQIVGEVQIQPSPSGTLDHATFIMNRWEG